MKKLILLHASFVCLSIAGCGSPELNGATDEIKTTAKSTATDALSQAGLAARGLLTTGNACLLAGQSEALCGCLSSELGSQPDAKHVEGLTAAVKSSLNGDVGAALQSAGTIDPKTRAALTKCATRAAIAEAMGQ